LSRIASLFDRLRAESRLGLFGYITVGYPNLDDTPVITAALAEAGADLVELGIPFSDPLAEGRTIQRTSQRALANGVTVRHCLAAVGDCRRRTDVPIVLMGYMNPILAYGLERFAADSASAGVDGLIVIDVSLEDAGDLRDACAAAGLDLILVVAPTSTEARIRTVAELASGFIYCIAVTGVTGSRADISDDVDDLLARVRAQTSTPLALGFGISKPEHLRRLSGKVDAAIVGSALLDAIEEQAPAESAARFVKYLRGDSSVVG
jgi:tryptophan synthase alpha chain